MPRRFLHHRAAVARDTAAATVEATAARVQTLVHHAEVLADRLDALPLLPDVDLQRDRQERVDHLREVVRSGRAWSVRYGEPPATGSASA